MTSGAVKHGIWENGKRIADQDHVENGAEEGMQVLEKSQVSLS